jgi:putative hydrolase of the HAD superfamily
LHYDHELACRNLSALTGLPEADLRPIIFAGGLQTRFETGLIDSEAYADHFRRLSGLDTPTDQINRAISEIFWLNRSLIPILTALAAAQYPIGILSNTCQSHWEWIEEHFPIIKHLIQRSRFVLSYECRCMKPDPGIYERAIEIAQVPANQIFFTDDRPENVAAACQQGIRAQQFKTSNSLLHSLLEQHVFLNI